MSSGTLTAAQSWTADAAISGPLCPDCAGFTRTRLTEKARAGDPRAQRELPKIRERQRQLLARRDEALAVLRREPELIAPYEVIFLAHALVVPSSDPEDQRRHDEQIEAVAVQIAWAHEEAHG